MATAAVRSEPQVTSAAPAHPAPAPRRGAASVRQTILGLQRTAGNAAVARAIAPRALQRCGAGCGCTSCGSGAKEEELLDERTGAGLLRSAVARRSA